MKTLFLIFLSICVQLCVGLVSGSGGVEKIPSVQRSVLAKRRLVQLVNNHAKLLALCSCILPSCPFNGNSALVRELRYFVIVLLDLLFLRHH